MSEYYKIKALRIPSDKYFKTEKDKENFENKYQNEFWSYPKKFPYFEFITTCGKNWEYKNYLDLVLESKEEIGDWSRGRHLHESEKEKVLLLLKNKLPNINIDDVCYVEYCYYNAGEPADCYDYDEFNEDIKL